MKNSVSYFFVFVFISFSGFAQNDSIRLSKKSKNVFLKKQILPASLIVTGTLLNIGNIKYDIQNKIPNTNVNIDDYFQHIPMVQMYLYDALGFKHQNSVFDQTKYLMITQLISNSIQILLKRTTKVQRPIGGKTSFPSGHTTNAFVGATVLFHEFKDTEPLLAYSGYLFATATGVLRITNNAHWVSDVLTGAGIGILSANLVYYFKPLKNFQPFTKKKDLVIIPLITPNSVGLSCKF